MSDKKVNENKSASQRLANLENGLQSMYNVLDNLAKDTITLKDAVNSTPSCFLMVSKKLKLITI